MVRMRPWLALLPLVYLPGAVHAHDLSLDVTQHDLDVKLDSGVYTTTVARIGLRYFETLGENFEAGLFGGYLDIDPDHEPATEQMTLTGNYAGIEARTWLHRDRNLELPVVASFGWNQADDQKNGQDTQWRWREFRVEAGVAWTVGALRFSGGGRYLDWDGEETAKGPIQHTEDIRLDKGAGAYAGIEYLTGDGGRIGLFGDGGAESGVRVSFATRF